VKGNSGPKYSLLRARQHIVRTRGEGARKVKSKKERTDERIIYYGPLPSARTCWVKREKIETSGGIRKKKLEGGSRHLAGENLEKK